MVRLINLLEGGDTGEMEHADSLLGLLEASIGLAGFTAIVLVLADREAGSGRVKKTLVRGAFSTSMGTAFSCLMPLAVAAAGFEASSLWQLSSGLMLPSFLIFGGYEIRSWLRLHRSRRIRVDGRILIGWAFFGAPIVIHVANAFAIPNQPSFGAYYLATVLLAMGAGLQFMFLLFHFLGRRTD